MPDIADSPSTSSAAVDIPPVRVQFTASGSEYFRIWIVNLLLTIVTAGIYSAWAKVRRLRYFYANTRIDGVGFEYHGNPFSILKGRAIALVIFALYSYSSSHRSTLTVVALLLMAAASPWMVWNSLRFRLHNSSYRGIRFAFLGGLGQAYRYYLLGPVLAAFTLYLGLPLVYQRIKRYQHGNSAFGTSRFSFHAPAGAFYRVCGLMLLIGLAGTAALAAAAFAVLAPLRTLGHGAAGGAPGQIPWLRISCLVVAVYAATMLVGSAFNAMLQRLIWNATRLGEHRIVNDIRTSQVLAVALTNTLGVIFTLGLYTPFARVRWLRLHLESMVLVPAGSLDDFCGSAGEDVSSLGEGVSDVFDFDFSL